MKTSAYLNFDGNCAEAFQFYAKTFPGKDLHIMKQGDMQKGREGAGKGLGPSRLSQDRRRRHHGVRHVQS
jgi:uncharacterized glyoxalase superfamily protein PhnB